MYGILLALVSLSLTIVPIAAYADDESKALTLPANLNVPASLKPILEDVLRRSPTFREEVQMLRRAPHVRVTISFGNLSIWHVVRAESRIYRYQFGALLVDTRLYTLDDTAEVIAHELEHVREAIEGLDVRALADRKDSGVYKTGPHYETRRAVLIGRQVAQEALDNFTELASRN